MYKKIIIGILLSLFLIKIAYSANIVLSSPDSERSVNIDSYKENEKLYIHLPSLVIKVNGTIGVQDNIIKILVGKKNVNLDFQSNVASINEVSTTKLIQFQNQIKLWQDTIWIEINDAKTLVKYMTGDNLEVREDSLSKTTSIENITKQDIQQTKPDNSRKKNINNLEEEISEKNLLEEIRPVQENTSQKKEDIFTLNSIYIDPGHGGDDRGITFPSGKQEKEITLLFGINLNTQMGKNHINVVMSRENDKTKNMSERCSDIVNKKVDCFLSIHTETPQKEKEGIYIIVPKVIDSEINKKSNYIADEIIKSINEKYKNIEIKKILSPLILCDYTNVPGILIEIYPQLGENLKEEKWDTFLDNKSDIYALITDVIKKAKNFKDEN